nr:hypothetical protein [Tanacetum cinerariifolium]
IISAAQPILKFQSIGRCNNYDMLQKNPFIAPVNIQIIESYLNRVGYQRVVDKVSAFYMKFLAKPWKTLFKKKDYIQYLNKFTSISPRVKEDYHSIKDDVTLVSVYTTGNVNVRGMLIPKALLADEIRATDDYKEYETVFVNVVVLVNKPQLVVSTQGTHRLEPGSHKEHPKVVSDDDANKEEEKDEKDGKTPILSNGGDHKSPSLIFDFYLLFHSSNSINTCVNHLNP